MNHLHISSFKEVLLILFLLGFGINLYCAQQNEIIPGASYFIYDGATGVRGDEVPHYSRGVNFYSYNGQFLGQVWITKLSKEDNSQMIKLLDPKARKPQPVRYEMVSWPEIHESLNQENNISGKFIVFYDKYNNKIANYRYTGKKFITKDSIAAQKTYKNNGNKQLTIGEVLDLSILPEFKFTIRIINDIDEEPDLDIFDKSNLENYY